MEPIFIYYNDLKFKDNKVFTIEFSNADQLQGVMFNKSKDYYLTSITCFIQLTELIHFEKIKKISDLSNDISNNGIDHLYVEKELEAFFGDSNRVLSVEIVEFFDYMTKQKRFLLIYSPYKELKEFGLKFERKKNLILVAIL